MEKYRKGCLCGEGGGVLASRQGKAHQLSSSPDNYTPEHLLTWTPGHLDNCTPAHLLTWTPGHLNNCTSGHQLSSSHENCKPEQMHTWTPGHQLNSSPDNTWTFNLLTYLLFQREQREARKGFWLKEGGASRRKMGDQQRCNNW